MMTNKNTDFETKNLGGNKDMNKIDVKKYMGEDAPEGHVSEGHCKTLHEYHKILWGKQLPNGSMFDLEIKTDQYENKPLTYSLHHNSDLGEFIMTSDWMCNTFLNWKRLSKIKQELNDSEINAFDAISTRIGNYIIFPRGGKTTGQELYNRSTQGAM